MVKSLGISHVGIAVLDLEKTIAEYTRLFEFDEIERMEVGSEGVKVAMLRSANTEIELLCPTSDSTSVAKFIRERGEGIHHLAIRVPDVQDAIASARALGLRVMDERPRKAAGGAEAAFVHPKSMHGVLLEFYDR